MSDRYALPGVAGTRRESVLVGLGTVATLVIVALIWRAVTAVQDDGLISVIVATDELGDGISSGTSVTTRGVEIGEVTEVLPSETGTIELDLALDGEMLLGLDDSLRIEFAPENVFGISSVGLVTGPGGTELTDGARIDLTGDRGTGVTDATMSAMMRQASEIIGTNLTPQVVDLLHRTDGAMAVIGPLLRTLMAIAGTVEETQRMPLSDLASELGRAAGGLGMFGGATVEVFDVIRSNEPLRNDRAHFDNTVDVIVNDLLPGLVALGNEADENLGGFTPVIVPLLDAVAASVPDPALTSQQLGELVRRLDSAFMDGPHGPVLRADVDLHGVPGVVPLPPGAGAEAGAAGPADDRAGG